MAILGTTLVFSVGKVSVTDAQEKPIRLAASESASEKDKLASKRGEFPEGIAPAKPSHSAQTGLLGRFADDQREIWSSPARLRISDAQWLVPLSGVTAGLFLTDRDFTKHLSQNPTTITRYKTISNAGVGALIGGAGGMWLLGHARHDEHWSETGFLAGEAALSSLVAVETFKYSLRRERPYQGDGSGQFFQHGTSFPSEHAAAAWTVAGVIAHEYPGPFTKIVAYGLASLVSVSRVQAHQHFPSDVLVGTVIGNLVAQNIYSRHHNPDLGGGEWRPISELFRGSEDRSPANQGSPYVPLDSWVYPAFDRLSALGFLNTGFTGMRPWTRIECAHLVQDASDKTMEGATGASEASRLVDALESEFAQELNSFRGNLNSRFQLESVYSRTMDISGKPLADSYHFGQTIINDYGRPFEEGFNALSGLSGYATAGRYSIYIRGEYQHAPSAPAYSLAVRQAIATADSNALQPANPISTVNQFELLDSYAGVHLDNWELTFGKQSLWWGPAEGGALMLSDNAEPFVMFRARRTVASELPWILEWLGPTKVDLFFGQLAGNQFPPRPLIHGEKISFKPTTNLEFGFSRTSEFGGTGRPLTPAAVFNSYFGWKSSDFYAASDNPGKRTLGFDFSYKIPRLRNWLTLYADALLPEANNSSFDTSPSPLYAPRRAAVRPGIYLSHVPRLAKLDFRVEASYTDPPTARSRNGQYIYWNDHYHDLYTNKNNLIGDWIGREGMGFQGWSTYWFSPRNSLQFGYRHAKVASDFIPGGETLNDGSIKFSWWVRQDLSLSTFVQYEQWKAPLLAPIPQTNWTSSVEIALWPQRRSK